MTTLQGAQRPLSGRDDVARAADDPDGPGDEGKVESVVKKWLVYEDEVVANQLQQEEIRRHYGLNRQTRQTVRGDIPVAKELQSGEELEAAIARQRHLDELQRRTENDERIAREIAERMSAATAAAAAAAAAGGGQQERERARQLQLQQRRRQQQRQQQQTAAAAAAADAVAPSSLALMQTPGQAPAAAAAASAAVSELSHDTTIADEELARRIQAEERERYERRRSEHARRRTADASSQRQQPAARPRSDGTRLATANGGGGPNVAADERQTVPSDPDAGTGGSSGSSSGRVSGNRSRPAAPLPVEPAPPPFVRGTPRQDMASRRLSGGPELASRLSRQPERQQQHERQQRQRREDSGDFADFYVPPGQGMSEDQCRQLQEEQDAEIARLLQEQEHKRTGTDGGSSSKLKQLEQHDAELARIMQEEERLRAQKRAIKQRQRALQELIGAERSSAGEATGVPSISPPAAPPLQAQTRSAAGYRGGHPDDNRLHRLSNGNHGQPSRAIPNASVSGGLPPAKVGGDGEGLYDSPWDLTRVEDQLMRLRGTESVPVQEAPGADEVRLRSGDRVGSSNAAESVDPLYKRRSREFQKRMSGDFGPQSRQMLVPVDLVPPAPTQPAPPPPSAARPTVAPSKNQGVDEVAEPTDWAPIPGQRRSQRRSKSKKSGGCKQQ